MLTVHLRLCQQRGIDLTRLTQVGAYAELVEMLLNEKRDAVNRCVEILEKGGEDGMGVYDEYEYANQIRAAFPDAFKEQDK